MLFHDTGYFNIETIPLICSASQWTGLNYMIGTSVLKELNSYYKGILPKLGQYQGYNYYSCCKVVIFGACKLLVWCILRKMKVCFPECEKKSLSDVPREKWNYIKVPDQTWEIFDGEHCAEVMIHMI